VTRGSAELAPWCRQACLALPGATVDWPWGPDSDVLRVHHKMFALLWRNPRVSEHPIVNLKAEPDEVPLLIAAHDFVGPGFHMNKRHWITVELGPGTDLRLVEELIEDSYDNVVAGLPARLRSTLRSLGAGSPELGSGA
jgi:predicted DNA-binding protein (MmcQ/YjbR family)